MRNVTITPELVDVDVCYGDYDGFVAKTIWTVEMFEGKEQVSTMFLKTEEFAKEAADKFVRLGLCAFGYC
jgi:hypothetical protein